MDIVDHPPSPADLRLLDTPEQKRAVLFQHVERLRKAYGDECPNCGGDLNRQLIMHCKVSKGVCASSPPPPGKS